MLGSEQCLHHWVIANFMAQTLRPLLGAPYVHSLPVQTLNSGGHDNESIVFLYTIEIFVRKHSHSCGALME